MDVGGGAAPAAAAPTRWSTRANAGKDFRTKLAYDAAWSETPASKYRSQMSRVAESIAAPAAAAAVISASASKVDALLGVAAAMAELAQFAGSGGQSGSRTGTSSPTPAETDAAAAVLSAHAPLPPLPPTLASHSMLPLRRTGSLRSDAPEHIVGESMDKEIAPTASSALAHDLFRLAGAPPSTQSRASDSARHSRPARCACRFSRRVCYGVGVVRVLPWHGDPFAKQPLTIKAHRYTK